MIFNFYSLFSLVYSIHPMHETHKNNGWRQPSKVYKLRFYAPPLTEKYIRHIFYQIIWCWVIQIFKLQDRQRYEFVSSSMHARDRCFVTSLYVTDLCQWSWMQGIQLARITYYQRIRSVMLSSAETVQNYDWLTSYWLCDFWFQGFSCLLLCRRLYSSSNEFIFGAWCCQVIKVFDAKHLNGIRIRI